MARSKIMKDLTHRGERTVEEVFKFFGKLLMELKPTWKIQN
jgi:hypothetical protein